MFRRCRSKGTHVVKHPVESVWFGMEPLLFLNKIFGFWPQVSFQKPDLAQDFRKKRSYFSASWLRKRSIYYIILFVLGVYIHTVSIMGESQHDHKVQIFRKLAYFVSFTYFLNDTLPILLTLGATSKLVQFLNNMADLDVQLQVQAEDCRTIRRKSWVYLAWIITVTVTHMGLCSGTYQWWIEATGLPFLGYISMIIAPTYSFYAVTLIMLLVQLMQTLGHRFQLITAKAVKMLGTIACHSDDYHIELVENSKTTHESTLVVRLNEIRQQHEFLQDNVELFHDLSAALIGCIIPTQIFLIITESFSMVRNQKVWLVKTGTTYIFAVALRVGCFLIEMIAIFWAADELKSHMVGISRAVQKYSFIGLRHDEQFQIQLLSSLPCRCRTAMNPAGFFSLTRAVIPAITANIATFFIIQFQAYEAEAPL